MSAVDLLRRRAGSSAHRLAARARGGSRRPAAVTPPPPGLTVPVSALRVGFEGLPDDAAWSVDPDGVHGRALVQGLHAVVLPLRLDRPSVFAARIRLLPHDWRDGTSSLTVGVAVRNRLGEETTAWSAVVAPAAGLGREEGTEVICRLPAGTVALLLRTDRPPQTRASDVGRVAWVDPRIIDPSAPAAFTPTEAGDPVEPPETRRALDRKGQMRPLISVLIPIHDPPPAMLEEAVRSVREQTFDNWQLCLLDDGSHDPTIIESVRAYAAQDDRIISARHERAGGISSATNGALELASAEYIALLDHDDVLAPTALARVAEAIATDPSLDMIYSDEDIVSEDGRTIGQSLKPAWSPETMGSLMYTCHLGVYRRDLAHAVGGFDSDFDGCQDYDFVLRISEQTERVAHIQEPLYRWRAHASSTAGGEQAKPYAYVAQPRAIGAHLKRLGVKADVQFGAVSGMHRIVYDVDETQSTSIVMALSASEVLEEVADALGRLRPDAELILISPPGDEPGIRQALERARVPPARIRFELAPRDGDPHVALARAAQRARSSLVVLLEQPSVGLTHRWLDRLLGYAVQPRIAAAGAVVLSPSGSIQEAGVAIPRGIPLPLLNNMPGAAGNAVAQNVSAVCGVVATRREVLDEVGGLRAEFGPLQLVDFCLRARRKGLRTVIVPDARLRAVEPDTTTNDLSSIRRLHAEHAPGDPYYNPRYRDDRGDYALRVRL